MVKSKKIPMWVYRILVAGAGYLGSQLGDSLVNKEWILYLISGTIGGTF